MLVEWVSSPISLEFDPVTHIKESWQPEKLPLTAQNCWLPNIVDYEAFSNIFYLLLQQQHFTIRIITTTSITPELIETPTMQASEQIAAAEPKKD